MSICVELLCNECHEYLDHSNIRGDIVDVDPCKKCLSSKYDEGFEDGKNEENKS